MVTLSGETTLELDKNIGYLYMRYTDFTWHTGSDSECRDWNTDYNSETDFAT